MKILFLEIDTEQTWALASVGPAFIASYIRKHGHDAALLRVQPIGEIDTLIRGIEKESPDLIGFSLTARQLIRGVHIACELRKKLDIPIIAGGLHPTFAPLSILKTGAFDYVCLGEGEEAVCDLLTHMEKGTDIRAAGIPNIWVRGLERPEIRPPIAVDHLPFMARDLFDEIHGVFHISTMRGCPFSCTYCAGGAIRHLYGGRQYLRRRSVGNVLEELRQIRKNTPINYVIFLDDTFTLQRDWLDEFCAAYTREIGAGFSINARAETVSPDMITMLAQAGCKHIIYGVESGSRRVREDILRRPGDIRRVVDAFKWTKQAGVLATANYMIGIPGETPEDIEQTLTLNEELNPDDFAFFVFYPFPGTLLFQTCLEKGYLPDNYSELPANNRQSILTLPGLTKDDLEHYYSVFSEVRENHYRKRFGTP